MISVHNCLISTGEQLMSGKAVEVLLGTKISATGDRLKLLSAIFSRLIPSEIFLTGSKNIITDKTKIKGIKIKQ